MCAYGKGLSLEEKVELEAIVAKLVKLAVLLSAEGIIKIATNG